MICHTYGKNNSNDPKTFEVSFHPLEVLKDLKIPSNFKGLPE